MRWQLKFLSIALPAARRQLRKVRTSFNFYTWDSENVKLMLGHCIYLKCKVIFSVPEMCPTPWQNDNFKTILPPKKQPINMMIPEEVNTTNCSILIQIKPTSVLLCVIFILELGCQFHLLSVLLTLKHHYCNLLKCCKSQSACKLILQHIYIRLRRTKCIWSFISMFCLTLLERGG